MTAGKNEPEPLWKALAPKFSEEWICLKCRAIYDREVPTCLAVLPNGRICSGAICVRIHRVYR